MSELGKALSQLDNRDTLLYGTVYLLLATHGHLRMYTKTTAVEVGRLMRDKLLVWRSGLDEEGAEYVEARLEVRPPELGGEDH